MVHVPLMFLSEWREFPSAPCLAGKKKWWQLASRCCWNRARRLTCFLSVCVTRKDLQFGTWTDPSFQRHYRFRPTTWEVGRAKNLLAPPRMCVHIYIYKYIYIFIYLYSTPQLRSMCRVGKHTLCNAIQQHYVNNVLIWQYKNV